MSTLHSYCLIILTHHKPFYILLTYFILNSYIHFPIYTIAHYYPITLYLHFILYPSIESNILYFHLIPLHLYSLYIHYNKKKNYKQQQHYKPLLYSYLTNTYPSPIYIYTTLPLPTLHSLPYPLIHLHLSTYTLLYHSSLTYLHIYEIYTYLIHILIIFIILSIPPSEKITKKMCINI